MTGILAVWNDRAEEIAAEYERWYVTEHIPERLAVPGFRSARRYEAASGDRQFFTFYELDSVEVLASPAYTACLASPTSLTRSVMPRFHGMIRSVFEEAQNEAAGSMVGGAALVLRFPDRAPDAIPREPGLDLNPAEIVGQRLWIAPSGAESAPTTTESRIRPGRDEAARAAVVIETTRVATAERLASALREHPGAAGAVLGCFGLLSIHAGRGA
jgi:hypothetical protein